MTQYRDDYEKHQRDQLRMAVAALALNGILSRAAVEPEHAAKLAVQAADALAIELAKPL